LLLVWTGLKRTTSMIRCLIAVQLWSAGHVVWHKRGHPRHQVGSSSVLSPRLDLHFLLHYWRRQVVRQGQRN